MTTAVVYVLNNKREPINSRILLDTCSTANLITEKFARSLNLPMKKCMLPIGALNSLATSTKYCIRLTLKSKYNEYKKTLEFLTVPSITDFVPGEPIPRDSLKLPRNLPLADPEFYRPSEIQMLIGSGPTMSVLSIGQCDLSTDGHDLFMQKTRFGWVIGGNLSISKHSKIYNQVFVNNIVSNDINNTKTNFADLEKTILKFWEIEEPPSLSKTRCFSPEEKLCVEHFKNNTTQDSTGRIMVALPFKNNLESLGSSREIALKRLLALKRRLDRDQKLAKDYSKVIDEYLSLGHMHEVKEVLGERAFYHSHFPIIKESSDTTKTRAVMDASAKTSTGISLNDTLMVGPTIQDTIFALHLRFRLHKYVITADIEKMYRQVLVRPEDRPYQRILWFRDNKVIALQSNVLLFGEASAPYLAIAAIHMLAKQEGKKYPMGAKVLLEDVYVDDITTGTNSINSAIIIRDELTKILKSGGFTIRQWASNDSRILEGLQADQVNAKLDLDKDGPIKTLGVYWNAKNDEYIYAVKSKKLKNPITKRIILSEISKIYDPLGLLGPVSLYAKCLVQKCWQTKVDWDESVPMDLYTTWSKLYDQLSLLNNLSFERHILLDDAEEIELHGFSDASERGYGACIYLRSIRNGKIKSVLFCAKSRVAPLKSETLPRLELKAATVLAELYAEVMKSINIKISKTYFWTDSTIAIYWIRTPAHNLKTFVANRVSIIQNNTKIDDWWHVRSQDNPADALSRGQTPIEFLQNKTWKSGPSWLSKPKNKWPQSVLEPVNELPEVKKNTCLVTKVFDNSFFQRFSNYNKLLRMCSYWFRLIHFLKFKTKKYVGFLSGKELLETEMKIVKQFQSEAFSEEIRAIKLKRNIKNRKTQALDPFVDENGLLRVGGRTQKANISYNRQHPMLLPSNNFFTDMIIRESHINNLHAGIQTTLYAIRQKFWIPDGRNQIRNIVRKCVICFRANPQMAEYKMGNLPSTRLEACRPFSNTGVDYCGPFYIKEGRYRNSVEKKVYVAIFICMVVKAVHIEVVSDLTSEAFIAALKRFVGRRGRPKTISCDNATNFVGAKNDMNELYKLIRSEKHQSLVNNFSSKNNIEWHFIPPLAPHFGGLWESNVKIFKHHFKRVTHNLVLSFENLNTLAIEIESIINSRPISPVSNDPNDLSALSPGHFLIGEPLTSLPENNFQDIPSNRLSMNEHLTKLRKDFWVQWKKEYLNELNIRHKWKANTTNLQVGMLVILQEKNEPTLQWDLGRITKVIPGDDDIVRTVMVKTAHGVYERSAKQLAPLPIDYPEKITKN